jgi:uncharacterized membrane protein YoaK (UPF0700 family)
MQPRTRYSVSTLLTWIAGYVDAVGWLTYQRTYTANMSGNSVAIGIQAAAGNWGETLLRAWPVAMYVVGLVGCRIVIEIAARSRKARIAWLLFLIEIAFLGAAMTAAPGLFVGIALLALAMGVQNGALTRFGGATVHTGFVTGTLVQFSVQLSKYLLGDGRSFRNSVWMMALWIAYVAGAVVGALADRRWALPALLVPALALAGLAAYDLRTPLAIEDERVQVQPSR